MGRNTAPAIALAAFQAAIKAALPAASAGKLVQSGSYLGEDDIVRFEDRYGREGTNS